MAEMGRGSWLGPVFGSLVVVGSGVWIVVGLWLKWVVGRRRSSMFGSGEVMARSAWVTAWLAGSSEFSMGFFIFYFFL